MQNWVDRVLDEWTPGCPMAFFSDFDGTLAPLSSHPKLAVMPASSRRALAAIAATPDVTVGVISGRPIGALKEAVGLPNLWYAGSRGMHIDIGSEVQIDTAIDEFEPLVDSLLVALSGPVQMFPGTWIERKPGCLTLHFRSLLPLMGTCFVAEVRDAIEGLKTLCPPLRVKEGARAIDITLVDAWTKGDAIGWMLTNCSRTSFTVFACDAPNDQEAVAIVNARGGLTIGVGPDAPEEADIRVATPEEFADDLARLAREPVFGPRALLECVASEPYSLVQTH